MRDLGEIVEPHRDGVRERAGVEHNVHKHELPIERAQRRHRAPFAIRKHPFELVFVCHANVLGANQLRETPEIHITVGRHHSLHRFPIGETDHGFVVQLRRQRFLVVPGFIVSSPTSRLPSLYRSLGPPASALHPVR